MYPTRPAVFILLALLLASCWDHAAPTLRREVVVPADALECIRSALRARDNWRIGQRRVHPWESVPDQAWVLHLPNDEYLCDVMLVPADERPRLLLHTCVLKTDSGLEAAKEVSREHLRLTYEHLRVGCPQIPHWSDTAEEYEDFAPTQESGQALARFWLWVGLVLLVMLAAFGLLAQRAARSRTRGGTREDRIPWPPRGEGRAGNEDEGTAP